MLVIEELILLILGVFGIYSLFRILYHFWKYVDLKDKQNEINNINNRYEKAIDFSRNSDKLEEKQKVINDFLNKK